MYRHCFLHNQLWIENQRSVSHSLWNLSIFFWRTGQIHNKVASYIIFCSLWSDGPSIFLKRFSIWFFTARLPLGFSLHIETWKATWNTINMTLYMSKNKGQMCINPIVYIIWFNFIYTVSISFVSRLFKSTQSLTHCTIVAGKLTFEKEETLIGTWLMITVSWVGEIALRKQNPTQLIKLPLLRKTVDIQWSRIQLGPSTRASKWPYQHQH